MAASSVENKILKKISPTKVQQDQISKVASTFIKKLQSQLKSNKIKAEVILGGSVAKGTFLSNKTDVDVFVRFDYQLYQDQSNILSSILLDNLKQSFPKVKIAKVHGSRDYYQLKIDQFDFEIVPILLINQASEAINITDISPLHSVWINKQAESIKNQIRLTKQFAKANGCYGAESYISGFSGYSLEILTIHYKSFQALIEAATTWKKKQVIDVENFHKGKDIFMEIDIAKLNSPLIIVDPVDKYRNVTAALNEEKWKRFKQAAKNYIKSPNSSFFENTLISHGTAKEIATKKKRNLIYLEITAKDGKRDVIGCKLLKVFEHLKTKLKDFQIRESDWSWDPAEPARFFICTAKKQLPKETIKQGPPLNMLEAIKNFKQKNEFHDIFEQGDHLFAKVPIKVRDLESVTKNILKNKYLVEKIDSIKLLEIIIK